MKKRILILSVIAVAVMAALSMPAFASQRTNVPQRRAALAAVTPTVAPTTAPTPAPTASDEEQIAQLAAKNPPPTLSKNKLGITKVACDLGGSTDATDVEGKTFYCGTFTVPQNWDKPDGKNLDLSFVVVKATGDQTAPDPMVFLAGGPGQGATLTGVKSYEKLRATRDIVRMDQRGTGQSQRLDVMECLVLAVQDKSAQAQVEDLVQAISVDPNTKSPSDYSVDAKINQICYDQFTKQGLDLNQFDTANSARDVIELVKALGYPSYNLHGISYGTNLAMNIMRETPKVASAPVLRSVVLDSTVSPSVYVLSSLPRNQHDQVMQLLDDCAQDEKCRTAYPNLQQRLHDLFAQLKAKPLSADGKPVTVQDVANQLTFLTGSRAAFMPRMIAELEQGKTDTYLALLNKQVGQDGPEGQTSLDLSDPVQAFIADGLTLVIKAQGQEGMFMFILGVAQQLANDDPLTALTAFINATYDGEVKTKLLERLTKVTAADIAASSYVEKLRADAAKAAKLTPEQKAAQQKKQERMLALQDVARFLNHNIHCIEDYQFQRLQDGINTYNDLEFPELADLTLLESSAHECEDWPVKTAPLEFKDPVSSTIPTLILQGAYDTRTPPYMGRRASRELENSTLVMVPQQGHEVWTDSNNCIGQIATAFVQDPTKKPELSCLDVRKPQWSMPNDDLGIKQP